MDIIAQLQEQANKIAYLAFTTVGTFQRDAPPSQLAKEHPEMVPLQTAEELAAFGEQPKAMAAALVQAAKQFDALVAALPVTEGGEEEQLKRIAELQAENEAVGKDLFREMDAAEWELKQVRDLFHLAADNCLSLYPHPTNNMRCTSEPFA